MPDDSAQQEIYLIACAELMDDALREELHSIGFEDEALFLKAYCEAHLKKFNEEFIVN